MTADHPSQPADESGKPSVRRDEGAIMPGSEVVKLASRRRELPQFTRMAGRRPPTEGRVLVVEDDEDDFHITRQMLERAPQSGFIVDWATSVESALRRLAAERYDACIVDYRLPGRSGLDLVHLAKRRGFTTPMVLVSGMPDDELEDAAIAAGTADFIDKEELEVARLERCIRFAIARKQASDRIDRLAQYDELTGVANRALFSDRLQHALSAARRSGLALAVMILDLNDFKPVNDRLGHAAGDHILKVIADRLTARLRESDTVARPGGDEFAILVENLTKPEHAGLVARKVLDTISPPIEFDGHEIAITGSLGVAIHPLDSGDGADLLRHADSAMYRAKSEGGNRVRFHNEVLDRNVATGSLLIGDLERALRRDELEVLFQPQVTLRSPVLALATTLAWRHPDQGMIPLERFFALAEDGGLLERMTDWLIDATGERLAQWRAAGLKRMHLAVPLLSRRQLRWSQLAERIEAVLARHDLAPEMIEIEIDERLLMDELDAGGASLKRLHAIGVRLALSDFGGGLTSLTALRDAPIQTLKLSPELLRGTPVDRHRTLFADAIIQLARHMRLRLVARQVSDMAQLRMLRQAGCDAVEAPMMTPPLEAERCLGWLRQAARRYP